MTYLRTLIVAGLLGLLLSVPASAQTRRIRRARVPYQPTMADSTKQGRGPFAVVVSAGIGSSYYATQRGVAPILEQAALNKTGVPLTFRALWVPDHRLRLGLETGYVPMYSYKGVVNGQTGEVRVTAVPMLVLFQMPLAWLSGTPRSLMRRLSVTVGPGLYVINSKLDYMGTVKTSSNSLGWMAALAYNQPLGPRLGLSAEVKWYDAVAADDAAFAAQLHLNWRLLRW